MLDVLDGFEHFEPFEHPFKVLDVLDGPEPLEPFEHHCFGYRLLAPYTLFCSNGS